MKISLKEVIGALLINRKDYQEEIASGSIVFASGDNLTTEKKTSEISLEKDIHQDSIYKLIIDKPGEDTAGNLTVNLYDVDKTDDSNARDGLLSTLTVEKIASAGTYRSFLLQGLFVNSEKQTKIGMKFATDSGAITVYYKLYRL